MSYYSNRVRQSWSLVACEYRCQVITRRREERQTVVNALTLLNASTTATCVTSCSRSTRTSRRGTSRVRRAACGSASYPGETWRRCVDCAGRWWSRERREIRLTWRHTCSDIMSKSGTRWWKLKLSNKSLMMFILLHPLIHLRSVSRHFCPTRTFFCDFCTVTPLVVLAVVSYLGHSKIILIDWFLFDSA